MAGDPLIRIKSRVRYFLPPPPLPLPFSSFYPSLVKFILNGWCCVATPRRSVRSVVWFSFFSYSASFVFIATTAIAVNISITVVPPRESSLFDYARYLPVLSRRMKWSSSLNSAQYPRWYFISIITLLSQKKSSPPRGILLYSVSSAGSLTVRLHSQAYLTLSRLRPLSILSATGNTAEKTRGGKLSESSVHLFISSTFVRILAIYIIYRFTLYRCYFVQKKYFSQTHRTKED